MKTQKKLNVVLVVLIILLLSLISFVGIFYKKQNKMANRIPTYLLGTDLKGYRQVTLEPQETDDEEQEELEDDQEDENEVNEEKGNEASEENETSENTTEESSNNVRDYKKCAEVIKARLKSLKVDNYTVSYDENSGRIVITLPEDNKTDIILADITQKGKFTIKDAQTDEILLNNDDVKNVKFGTTQTSALYKTFYMSINFNMQGSSKFKKITKEYQPVADDENTVNETEENTEEETEENDENEIEVTESEESESDEEDEEESSSKEITLNIDDTTLLTTDFSEIVDNGVLTLTLGSITADEESDELYSAYNLGAIIENDEMPIQYEITGNTYIDSVVESKTLKAFIYIEIAIALAIALIMIIKFRAIGVFSTILSIGYLAILLIVIRYANVELSLEGIIAIELSYIVNSIFGFMICKALKEKNPDKKEKKKLQKEIITKYTLIIVPELIIAFVCCFTEWTSIYSFGMVIFWGIIISWIYNALLSKFLVR